MSLNQSVPKNKNTHARLKRMLPPIIAILVLFIIGNSIANRFISINNISSILMTASLLALMTVSQNTVVIAGNNGIDLSIGAIASCTALFCPMLPMDSYVQLAFAAVVALAIGAVFGSINGFFISFIRIPALIVTLIMGSVVSGVVMVLTRGQPSANISDLLKSLSGNVFPPIRMLTLIVIVLIVAAEIILIKTKIGRTLVLVGDNPSAARVSGINVRAVFMLAYIVGGAVAGLMGLLIVSYAGSTTLNMAESYTLFSLAAITIGGTNLSGGQGSYINGALGAILLIVLNSILQALNLDQGLRQVIQGGLLIAIMLFNVRASGHRT